MSDEFELEGRTFDDGHDPMWTSTTHSDDAQTSSGLGSQHFYNASYSTTSKGMIYVGLASYVCNEMGDGLGCAQT